MDAYRLESLAEAGPLRLAEILATPGTLICIEWAEKIAEFLPPGTIKMDLVSVSEDERLVTITSPDAGV
jgi:tRNA A37 threonylcarbamoyladenosine biosynthesis protein TsaE